MSGEKTSGENVARSNIKLPGNQIELVKEIYKTGKPVVVVLVNGRPLGIEWVSENIPAIIEAFEPGAFGGQAVAEIAFGKVNPSGKLPITFPRNVGQIRTFYNHKPSQYKLDYADGSRYPLYEFGYGLSYTTFEYGDLSIDKNKIGKEESATVSVEVKNTGKREGSEIVQLYIRDDYSSVTRPVKELKGFKRIYLKPGENKTITFKITPQMLASYNLDMNYVVESGVFTIMLGSSSRDKDLHKIKLTVK
jgi:beta-glucosidase